MKDYNIKLLKDIPKEKTESMGLNEILKGDEYIGTEEDGLFYIHFYEGKLYLEKDMFEIIKLWCAS
jgi:hypothetical protein